jgi:subtilase family serine protease
MHRPLFGHWCRALAGALTLSIGVAACGGGGHSATSAPLLPPPAPNLFTGASGFGWDEAFVHNSAFVKRASFGRMGFDVVVRLRDPEGLVAYAKELNRWKTRASHQFLTPEDVADRYFATTTDYQKAAHYLRGEGLRIATWPLRMMIHVNGTQVQLERAFSTKFGIYRHGNEQFIAPMVAPSVPKTVPIVGSENIVYRTQVYRPSLIAHNVGNGLLNGYSPQQVQQVFDYSTAYTAGFTGFGITIGVIGTGPVSVASAGHIGDLDALRSLYRAFGTNPLNVLSNLNPPFARPPAVTAPCSQSSNPNLPPSQSPTANCDPEDTEAQVDTEQIGVLAPGATLQFYLDYEPNDGNGFTAQGLALATDEIEDAVSSNVADVLSLSFGGDEYTESQESPPPFNSSGTGVQQVQFANAVVQGIAVFVSSGDLGANACQDAPGSPHENDLCVSYPASDQNVVAVGGVNTPMNSAGSLTGPITAWGEATTGGVGGTGGGVSNFIPQPVYQNDVPGVINSANCNGQPCRNVPDVAMEADPKTGVAVIINADPTLGGPTILSAGGTSVAAPEMAAMWGLVLNACKNRGRCPNAPPGPLPYRYGLPNTRLYNIYTNVAVTDLYILTFYNVQYGNNGQQNAPSPGPTYLPGYSPSPCPANNLIVCGYDQLTGLGVPYARALIRAVSAL